MKPDDVLVLETYEEGSHRFACRLTAEGHVELYDELCIDGEWQQRIDRGTTVSREQLRAIERWVNERIPPVYVVG